VIGLSQGLAFWNGVTIVAVIGEPPMAAIPRCKLYDREGVHHGLLKKLISAAKYKVF
jgi:hypothetical protein